MTISGTAAGVPYVAVPPAGGAREAPLVLAWHLLDAPRTEAAFAAALPLAGLDAWRVYLGLPLSGARLPSGGYDALLAEDPVLRLHGPVVAGALDEFPPALAELRGRLGLGGGPVGVLGGSVGGAVAQLAAIEAGLDVRAEVLVNPVVRLRATIDALSAHFGASYPWPDEAAALAERVDLVARAGETAERGPAVLVVSGADDLEDAFLAPARELVATLRDRGVTTEHHVVPGMAHALAAEPGTDPAPQTPHAREVDRVAVAWFTAHLTG